MMAYGVLMCSHGAAKEANLGARSSNMSQLGRQDDQLEALLTPFFHHFGGAKTSPKQVPKKNAFWTLKNSEKPLKH